MVEGLGVGKVGRPSFDNGLPYELAKAIFTLLCCFFHEIEQDAFRDSTEDQYD